MGFLKSFRTSTRTDLIRNGEGFSIVESALENQGLDYAIRIVIEANRKAVQLNGKKPDFFKDYYGLVPILLFEPRDVYLFRESPSIRRQFLGRALFLDQPIYLKIQRDYEEVLAQKNRLLKEAFNRDVKEEVAIWNEKLARLGAEIVHRRLVWIEKVNGHLSSEYQNISKGNEEVRIEYQTALPLGENGVPSLTDVEALLHGLILERSGEEFRRRESVVGPHRDDWMVLVNGDPIGSLGSQGMNRSAVIALKSVQVHIYEYEHGFPPLFLLDDVASELDRERTEALFSYLSRTKGQVFMTTTEPQLLGDRFRDNGTTFLIDHGSAIVE